MANRTFTFWSSGIREGNQRSKTQLAGANARPRRPNGYCGSRFLSRFEAANGSQPRSRKTNDSAVTFLPTCGERKIRVRAVAHTFPSLGAAFPTCRPHVGRGRGEGGRRFALGVGTTSGSPAYLYHTIPAHIPAPGMNPNSFTTDSYSRVAGRGASEGSGHVTRPEPVLHRGWASCGL